MTTRCHQTPLKVCVFTEILYGTRIIRLLVILLFCQTPKLIVVHSAIRTINIICLNAQENQNRWTPKYLSSCILIFSQAVSLPPVRVSSLTVTSTLTLLSVSLPLCLSLCRTRDRSRYQRLCLCISITVAPSGLLRLPFL